MNNITSYVSTVELKKIGDSRGYLIALENGTNVSFEIKRVYYIFGTQAGIVRGHHAHQKLKQLLVCTSGSCKVQCEWQNHKAEYLLDSPEKALFINGLVWHTMSDFTPDCILLVLADDYYNEKDYIRDYEQYLRLNNG